MATIICYDVFGNAVPVAPEALTFRPAVNGIFIENNQILLQKHPQTGLWHPPGSVLAENETPAQAIRHIFRDLTGMTPLLGPLLFVEDQYHIDDDRRAWCLSTLYYALERPMAAATLAEPDDSAVQPDWVSLDDLARHQMQYGYEAILAGKLQLKL
jgi:ADP-ribose pyrophosphatase YjhB (NUDIX family)